MTLPDIPIANQGPIACSADLVFVDSPTKGNEKELVCKVDLVFVDLFMGRDKAELIDSARIYPDQKGSIYHAVKTGTSINEHAKITFNLKSKLNDDIIEKWKKNLKVYFSAFLNEEEQKDCLMVKADLKKVGQANNTLENGHLFTFMVESQCYIDWQGETLQTPIPIKVLGFCYPDFSKKSNFWVSDKTTINEDLLKRHLRETIRINLLAVIDEAIKTNQKLPFILNIPPKVFFDGLTPAEKKQIKKIIAEVFIELKRTYSLSIKKHISQFIILGKKAWSENESELEKQLIAPMPMEPDASKPQNILGSHHKVSLSAIPEDTSSVQSRTPSPQPSLSKGDISADNKTIEDIFLDGDYLGIETNFNDCDILDHAQNLNNGSYPIILPVPMMGNPAKSIGGDFLNINLVVLSIDEFLARSTGGLHRATVAGGVIKERKVPNMNLTSAKSPINDQEPNSTYITHDINTNPLFKTLGVAHALKIQVDDKVFFLPFHEENHEAKLTDIDGGVMSKNKQINVEEYQKISTHSFSISQTAISLKDLNGIDQIDTAPIFSSAIKRAVKGLDLFENFENEELSGKNLFHILIFANSYKGIGNKIEQLKNYLQNIVKIPEEEIEKYITQAKKLSANFQKEMQEQGIMTGRYEPNKNVGARLHRMATTINIKELLRNSKFCNIGKEKIETKIFNIKTKIDPLEGKKSCSSVLLNAVAQAMEAVIRNPCTVT